MSKKKLEHALPPHCWPWRWLAALEPLLCPPASGRGTGGESQLPWDPRALFFSYVVYRFSGTLKEPAFSPRAAIDFSALLTFLGTEDWPRRPGIRLTGLPWSGEVHLPR